MSTLEVLIAARSRVARGWTQRAYARDAQGCELPHASHPDVDCMCAVGAINASARIAASVRLEAFARLGNQVSSVGAFAAERIIAWNDAPERTQADVLAAFDRAIAALEVAP